MKKPNTPSVRLIFSCAFCAFEPARAMLTVKSMRKNFIILSEIIERTKVPKADINIAALCQIGA
ncbi:MAG: hypothetical protein D6674_07175 [Acidobacteria bacterium]|jgi:hypothetical protein|nr:MAG: hypothetical protein D6674_07175 [Acidobacteriota bacterium]